MYRLFFAIAVIGSAFFFAGCNNNSSDLTIGGSFNENGILVGYTDTMTVIASTVLIDSLVTSNNNSILVGKYDNPYFGSTSAETYMPIMPKTTISGSTDGYTFDSLVLVLKSDGNYFGDTTILKTINVYQVMEQINQFSDYNLYNNSSFKKSDSPIASTSFYPSPKAKQEISVKLPDELGQEWFSWIINYKSDLTSLQVFFEDEFKGIAISPGSESSSAALSFTGYSSTDDAGIEIKLYYSIPDQEDNSIIRFIPTDKSFIFTHFESDRSGSSLAKLTSENSKLSSDSTDHLVFLQSGTGIAIRLEIPGIDRLYDISPNISILSANLRLHPHDGTYDNIVPLPTSLVLYLTDISNTYDENQKLYNITGTSQETSSLSKDQQYGENTFYYISALRYITTDLANVRINHNALLLTFPSTTLTSSFQQLVFDAQHLGKYSIKLELKYLIY